MGKTRVVVRSFQAATPAKAVRLRFDDAAFTAYLTEITGELAKVRWDRLALQLTKSLSHLWSGVQLRHAA